LLRIGDVECDNNLFLAPMAGITDRAFRYLCKEQGCALTFTEMVSAKGLIYDNPHSERLLFVKDEDRPTAVQIFGSDPGLMAEAASMIQHRFDIIDINMGCPTPKVVKNGEGAALMRTPGLAAEIIRRTVQAIKRPVTVKIRKGWDTASINAIEIGRLAEENGAAAVTIHGRTREEFYSGKVDWSIIRKAKQYLNIPVIGNGDVFTPEDAVAMIEKTGCDAVMIGRGAQGNPWIFSRAISLLQNGMLTDEPSMDDILGTIKRQLDLMIEYKEERIAIKEMRKHVGWYIRGMKNAALLRREVNRAETREQLFELLEDYREHLREHP
jgi:tRNA-dihydrouridine synthase B